MQKALPGVRPQVLISRQTEEGDAAYEGGEHRHLGHADHIADLALQALGEAYPDDAPFDFDSTRVIAVGISNGGGAVLRASEEEGDWLDAVVAGEPNIYAADAPGARSLYDYTTEAALLMPCALLDLPAETLPQPPLRAQVEPLWTARCAALKAARSR